MKNKLIIAGQQLSNICYNLKQDESLPEHVRASMECCVKEWDEALRECNTVKPPAIRKFKSISGFADGTTHLEYWPDGSIHVICPKQGGDMGDCSWDLEEIMYRVKEGIWEEFS